MVKVGRGRRLINPSGSATAALFPVYDTPGKVWAVRVFFDALPAGLSIATCHVCNFALSTAKAIVSKKGVKITHKAEIMNSLDCRRYQPYGRTRDVTGHALSHAH